MCVLCGNAIGCGTGTARRYASATAATRRTNTTAPTTYLRINSLKGKRGSLSRFELECLGRWDHFRVVLSGNRLRRVRAMPRVFLEPLQLDVHFRKLMPGARPDVARCRRNLQMRGHTVCFERA